MFACLYRPPAPDDAARGSLIAIAQAFSPRYESHHADLVSIDVSGLDRLLGPPQTIGEELRRDAQEKLSDGMRVHVAVAGTRMAALVFAHARPGLTIVPRGAEADALASVPLAVLDRCLAIVQGAQTSDFKLQTFTRWGLRTCGELAALPAAELVSRLGRQALVWQAIARGEDIRPLVPTLEEERFDASLDLEWPIDGLEPLSFVLTRLLEPLSTRLERRDRGVAVLHVLLRLVTVGPEPGRRATERVDYARRLELPTPMRDVRTLRTLALLDLESHPPDAPIDRVTIVIDPTPGRVLQHTLFTRAHPTPEQLSTLIARLGALMGQDRLGAPVSVDSYRPGAFAMAPFKTEHQPRPSTGSGRAGTAPSPLMVSPSTRAHPERVEGERSLGTSPSNHERTDRLSALSSDAQPIASALRRCRQPVPARVTLDNGRPVRVTTDRRGFVGGAVVRCAGPWRTSGHWWEGKSEVRSLKSEKHEAGSQKPVPFQTSDFRLQTSPWHRDEWDVSLNDGAAYRIFQDRETDAWFIDGVVD